jgi:hypothetical protein
MSVQAALARIVEEVGYIATSDRQSVEFKVEGVHHHFETFGNDIEYARLISSFALPANASANASALNIQANEQNKKSKAVKTVIYPEPTNAYVSYSIEMFFSDVAAWARVFHRSIGALRTASDDFFEAVNHLEVLAP